jgi:hypothetical protein
MGVDHLPRFGAVLLIDVAGVFGPAAGAEALAIRRRGAAVAPVRGGRIFEEKVSASRWNRPELSRLLDHLRKDDVLVHARSRTY